MAQLKAFTQEQIIAKIRFENPWWQTHRIDDFHAQMDKRAYFNLFKPLVCENKVKRAVVLMGSRRVGKTVMLYHLIQELINDGINPQKICYLSIENPIYKGLALEELFYYCRLAVEIDSPKGFYVFFDEIQYLKDWEIHLKTLVDSYHYTKFVASGSAAAALRLKSHESGAGRFTDFILPPLTFHEYIKLKHLDGLVEPTVKTWGIKGQGSIKKRYYKTSDINQLNKHFVDYINFGGYPEVSLSPEIQQNPGRHIRHDIIDKVLLRDLPSLYGIHDVQELNNLFTSIAYNSGNEFTFNELSNASGVSKTTIKRYIEYLEAAFLIRVIKRIDFSAKKFKRANFFKIYLTNPSLRTALFTPIDKDDEAMGNMVETAIFSQWSHNSMFTPYYARWQDGEVDMVGLNKNQKPMWALEIKWSNCFAKNNSKLINLNNFCNKNGLDKALITSIDIEAVNKVNNIIYDFTPASIYCYSVGRNIIDDRAGEVLYYA